MTVDFSALMRNPRDVRAPEGSINAQLLALPQQREHTHDLEGKILYFPRTDQVMVPYRLHKDGDWTVVVVFNGSRAPKRQDGSFMYPRGGHHLSVSELEMQTAIELEASEMFEVWVTLNDGRGWPLEAESLESARHVAASNSQHSKVEIISSITFEPEFPWVVAP